MGKSQSKVEAESQVVENSSGTHLFELHMPSMGFSYATIGLFLLCAFFLYLCYKALPRCCAREEPLFSELPRHTRHLPRRAPYPHYSMGFPSQFTEHPGYLHQPYVPPPMAAPYAYEERSFRHQRPAGRRISPAVQADIEEVVEEESHELNQETVNQIAPKPAEKPTDANTLAVRQRLLP